MNITKFYKFITERQNIFQRRFIDNQEPPWTKDPIFNNYSFCNVYRELDRTTLFYINNVAYGSLDPNPEDIIFSTILFRFFNRPLTYSLIRSITKSSDNLISIKNFSPRNVKNQLDLIIASHLDKNKYISIISHAYTISSHHRGIPTHHDIIDSVLYPISSSDTWIIKCLLKPQSLSNAFNIIRNIPYCGPFMSYEILCDLNYTNLWNFSENEYVNIGPGAKRGLFRLGLSSDYSISKLQNRTNKYLQKHDFPFFRNRLLSLRSIEHSLCEFDKYQRMKGYRNGTGSRASLRIFINNKDKNPIYKERKYKKMLFSPSMHFLYKKWSKSFGNEFV